MDLCKYGMIRVMKKKKQVYTAAACILGVCLSISPVAAADFSSGQSTEQTLVTETPQTLPEITEGSQGTSRLPEENLTESVETGGSEDILPSDSEQSQEDIMVDFGDEVVGGSDIEAEPGETTEPETENPEESTDLELEVIEEDPEGDLAGVLPETLKCHCSVITVTCLSGMVFVWRRAAWTGIIIKMVKYRQA